MSDVNPSTTQAFRQLLLQAWQGEVYGVQVFGSLAMRRPDPAEQRKLAVLVMLEQHVLDLLTPLLLRLVIPLDVADVEAQGERDTERQHDAQWTSLLRWISRDASTALGHYERLTALVPEDDQEAAAVAAVVIEHERALISFCTKELAGEDDSLADVNRVLTA